MELLEWKWQSREARLLHHRLGFAARKARKDTMKVHCWEEALALAARALCWTHLLDVEMEVEVDKASGDVKRPRSLVAHLSNVSTRLDEDTDDGCASIASTAIWEPTENRAGSSSRCPRRRPSQCAHRRRREQEQREVSRRLFLDGMTEVQGESGSLPT